MIGHIAATCDDRKWTPTQAAGPSAFSCNAYSVADMAAVAASAQLCKEHNERADAQRATETQEEEFIGNLDYC